MVKAIIFDLQGTLVSNGIFPSPLRQVKNILRLDMPFSDFVIRFEKVFMVGQHASLREAFVEVCDEFNVYPKGFILDKLVGLWNKNKLLSQLYPDTIQSLSELKPKYKLALVANIDGFSKDILDKFKLQEYFDVMLLSCDTDSLKGEGAFYSQILDKFGLPAEDVLMVGDSLESDMYTAKAAGIKGVLIDRHDTREYESKIVTLTELYKYLGENGE